jgi:lipoprotein-anchoring transpeptidase ErfK/SrfK
VSPRRLLGTVLVVAAAAGALPAAARADAPLVYVPPEGVDWTAGAVAVSAYYPAGTSSVAFSVSGQPLATAAVADTSVAGTISSGTPLRLTAPVVLSADARDAQGASLGVATLVLTPEMFTPSAPTLALPRGAVVKPSFTLGASTNQTVTDFTLTAAPEPVTHRARLVSGAGGRVRVSGVRVPYGTERLRLTVSNGFGSSPPSRAETVYSLGSPSRLPRRASYVLVDKSSMSLYDVRRRVVVERYDISIGVPSAPTPNGYFEVGAPQRSRGAWGVLRRPLYRFAGSKHWASGFYIHGTNAPWAIGTWASHGCVRLYNWAIRRFSRTVPNGTLVLIR